MAMALATRRRRRPPGYGAVGPGGGAGGRGHGHRSGPGGSTAAQATVTPPPGSFDPGMEAQRASSQRGLEDLRFDTARADRLGAKDLQLALHQTRRGAHRSLTDLSRDYARGTQDIGLRRGDYERSFARDLYDLSVADQRGSEDAARATANLQRKYTVMGEQQSEAAAAGGVSATRGGFAAQSAGKRATNQGIEQAPIDTARARQVADIGLKTGRLTQDEALALQDLATAQGRLGQDYQTGTHRTRQDLHTDVSGLKRTETRAERQRAIELSRAIREQAAYEPALTLQEYFAAHQANPSIHFPSAADIAAGTYGPHGHHRRRR